MNKLIRLNHTGIEYGDYAWNFASGCGNNIGGKCKNGGFNCWAYSITHRFAGHYPNGFTPTIYPDALLSPLYLKKPSRILCAFMGDLFGDWFNPDENIESILPSGVGSVHMSLKEWIYTTIRQCPQHTFIFLTKQPQNLPLWEPFPDNVYLGVSVTNQEMFDKAIYYLKMVDAEVKFLSMEPLLGRINNEGLQDISWVIIGQCTPIKQSTTPKIEWVREIVSACDKANVKVFLKDNLMPLILHCPYRQFFLFQYWKRGKTFELRQELPDGYSQSVVK